jgi:hypothetical protein
MNRGLLNLLILLAAGSLPSLLNAADDNPFDQAAQEGYTGRFRGQGIDLRLVPEAGKWKGTLLFQGRSYGIEAEAKASGLEGRFADGDQAWPFSVLSFGDRLTFTAASFTTTLLRQALPKLEGGWRSQRLLITFESAAPKPTGHIQFNGQRYSFVAEEKAGDLEGVFTSGDKSFPFRIANETRGLVFNTATFAELLTAIPNRSLLGVHPLPPVQFSLLNDGSPIQGQDGLYQFPGSPTVHLELRAKGYYPIRTNLTLTAYSEVSWSPSLERASYPALDMSRWTNSLGMAFVPIPGTKVLFSTWNARVQDYAAYAATAPSIDPAWRNVEFQGVPVSSAPNHPVTMVSWEDAHRFCRWLSLKEQQARLISADQFYRLPTDTEWSKAVGLENENEGLPVSKDERIKGVYPWGKTWPPPDAIGNFADLAAKARFQDFPVIRNYDDGFPTTSPVGRFPANRYGLYDMTGNVWQWCEDWYDTDQSNRVARGASWHSAEPRGLLSSHRSSAAPDARDSSLGFRCVLVTGESP